LLPENKEAMQVYTTARNQVIMTGMGQAIDISIPAVKIVMDLYNVKDQLRCLNKVRAAFYSALKREQDASRVLEPRSGI
jgi:hypothetical protein